MAALLSGSTLVAGCTGDDGDDSASGDSSVRSFCTALETFRADVDAADSADLPAYIRALKDAAGAVADVGVPDDIPVAAEQGFELTVSRIEDLADDATQDDVARLGDVSDEDQRRLDALEDYIEKACPDLGA
ncbi:hypothetical protein G5V58_23470 [Nocardioides anomalus]|uniref:Uncharacterized protein n=1 Tax=Nocardioides anomalus TaxID=2712223 RepID=A0A6G6WJI4_9ACTN|nr:hypothetical protein [Nocardioides anomalus]QIG45317.1 hypothetical protein G5V58_23470 [Nocardioides anomalus]